MIGRLAIGLTPVVVLFAYATVGAASPLLEAGPPYRIVTPLTGADGEAAQDVSGIACWPAPAGVTTLRCLLVNDEGRSVQFAKLGEGSLAAEGSPIPIIADRPSEATLGSAPDVETCRKKKPKFDELDGEGVAYAAPFFYVVGSHGCSRKKGKFELSAFILARMSVAPGGTSAKIETTYRLADAWARVPVLTPYFGRALDAEANGLNIEGISIIGDRLFAGLRAPSLDGNAFLVSVPLAELFKPEHDALPADASVAVLPLHLGQGVGIRDLAPLPDGRLLVLAGPAQEQPDVPYSLFAVEPREGGRNTDLGHLAPLPASDAKGKAEAVAIRGPDRVTVFFDSLPSGAPRDYRIDLH